MNVYMPLFRPILTYVHTYISLWKWGTYEKNEEQNSRRGDVVEIEELRREAIIKTIKKGQMRCFAHLYV